MLRFARSVLTVSFLLALGFSSIPLASPSAAVREVEVVALSGEPAPGTTDNYPAGFDARDTYLSPSGHVLFGSGTTAAFPDYGFWGGTVGAQSLVARDAELAPGGLFYEFLGGTRYAAIDRSDYVGLYAGTGTAQSHVGRSIWLGTTPQLERIVSEGDAAAGTDGSFLQLSVGALPAFNGGRTAFFATIEGPSGSSVNSDTDSGVWTGGLSAPVSLVARENAEMPGQPVGARFANFGHVSLDRSGNVYFIANSKFGVSALGIYRGGPGGLSLVADDDLFGNMGKLAVSWNERVAFTSTVGPVTSLVVETAAGFRTVVTTGEFAPDAEGVPTGATVSQILHFVIDDEDSTVVFAQTSDGKKGIWVERDGKLKRAVLKGDVAPGVSGNPSPTFNDIKNMTAFDRGSIAFEASSSVNPQSGAWRIDGSGAVKPLLVPGDQIEVKPGDLRTVTSARGPNASSPPSEFANAADGTPAYISPEAILLQVQLDNFSSAALVLVGTTDNLVVNHTGNGSDTAPGDGVCDTGEAPVDGKPRCTLRAAIQESNARPGRDRIVFDIPAGDPGHAGSVWAIQPIPALPDVAEPAEIDATTQPGYVGTPVVLIDGTELRPVPGDGFVLRGGDSVVRGFSIVNFVGDAIGIHDQGGNVVEANYLGVEPDGMTGGGCNENGVLVMGTAGNRIGGTAAAQRNLISNNGRAGTGGANVALQGAGATGNVLQGSWIGLDASGGASLENPTGVRIEDAPGNTVGGTSAAHRNLIGGNSIGVQIVGGAASGNRVEGNHIGVGGDGVSARPNKRAGVRIESAPRNEVGGLTGVVGANAGNIISGNGAAGFEGGHGVEILGATSRGTVIRGNLIGLGAGGDLPMGNRGAGIRVRDADSTIVGGADQQARNAISNNDRGGAGLANVLVSGATAAGTRIEGNSIGTTVFGEAPFPNPVGVRIDDAPGAVIGGAVIASENVISGNETGIHILGPLAADCRVQGNIIGLASDGATRVANRFAGVFVEGAPGAVIGGLTEHLGRAPGNIISGNGLQDNLGGHGVHVLGPASKGTVIQGNLIGLDITGTTPVGNHGHGILVQHADSAAIGSLDPRGANVVCASDSAGIRLRGSGADGAQVLGNLLGVLPDYSAPFGNGFEGIHVSSSSNNILSHNTVGASFGHGILIAGTDSDHNRLFANFVGTDVSGSYAFGNAGDGVRLDGAMRTEVGSAGGLDQNVIAHNGHAGLHVVKGSGNALRGVRALANGGLGIDLGETEGLTPNDSGDADEGPNEYANFPLLAGATEDTAAATVTVRGAMRGAPGASVDIDFYGNDVCDPGGFGEGETWLGSIAVLTDSQGDAPIAFATGALAAVPAFITAVATDAEGNSSEFSACVAVRRTGGIFVVNSTGDAGDVAPGDGDCDTGALVGGEIECTLRAALEETAALAGVNTILFDIEGGGPHVIRPASALPTAADVEVDGTSQPGYRGDPLIEVDGSSAGPADGLALAGAAAVTALAVGGFDGNGFVISGGAVNALRGNGVGVRADGVSPSPNTGNGILVTGGDGAVIGAAGGAFANRILHNGGDGVRVAGGEATAITGNVIDGNGGLGVDLAGGTESADGITENDPGDADSGPNGLQNAPELTAASVGSGGIRIEGSISSRPSASYRLEFFASTACDPSGYGEGEEYLGEGRVSTDAGGQAIFGVTLSLDTSSPAGFLRLSALAGRSMTAVAIDDAGNTSEFSNCVAAVTPVVLLAMSADARADGVLLSWLFTTDPDPVSCMVRRRNLSREAPGAGGRSPAEDWVRLNDALLTGVPDPMGIRFAYLDATAAPGVRYAYLVEGVDRAGRSTQFGPVEATGAFPTELRLTASPLPGGSGARLFLDLPADSPVRLAIYDVAGRLVRTFAEASHPAGRHVLGWDGRGDRGSPVPAGLYFARLQAGGRRTAARIVLVR